MKVFKFCSLLFLFASLCVLTSCNKDDDTDGGGGSSDGDAYLTCKIDGSSFEAEPITVGGISTGNNFSVQGNTGGLSAKAITITLNSSYNGVGVYNLGSDFLSNTAIYIPMATNPANSYAAAFSGANVGQVEITSDDGTYVEGTFSFECANQNDQTQIANITEGEFRMKLPE